MTIEQIKRALGSDEPRYDVISRSLCQDRDALNVLAKLLSADEQDPLLTAKAIHLVSKIDGSGDLLLDVASQRAEPTIRVAVAGAARNLQFDLRVRLVFQLLDDSDPGVRKIALNSVPIVDREDLLTEINHLLIKIDAISHSDPEERIRSLASSILSKMAVHPATTAAKHSISATS